MKKLAAFLMMLLLQLPSISFACPLCNKKIRDAVHNSQFYPNLLTLLSAFIALTAIVIILAWITAKRHKARLTANSNKQILSPVPLTTASVVLGIGLGGFIDGIVLHQVLQVHEMLSNKIAATNYIGKSVNMFWDGIFHFFCLIVTLIGVILLWKLLWRKDIDRSGKLLTAGLLIGWSIFNLVEGIIDHQILKLHNVIELSNNHAIANYSFLAGSLIMLIAGLLLVNSENKKRYTT